MDDREKQDREIGCILSRREAFSLLGGAAGAGVFSSFLQASATLPSCVGKPEQTEGPYFLDGMLNRSDVRSDPSDGIISDGIPPESDISGFKHRCSRLCAAHRRSSGSLALRCQGLLFGRPRQKLQHNREEVSARISGYR